MQGPRSLEDAETVGPCGYGPIAPRPSLSTMSNTGALRLLRGLPFLPLSVCVYARQSSPRMGTPEPTGGAAP